MLYYAQINADGIVYAVSRLKEKRNQNNLIEIPEFDSSLLDKKYNQETKIFEEIKRDSIEIEETLEEKVARLEEKIDQLLTMKNEGT